MREILKCSELKLMCVMKVMEYAQYVLIFLV